MTEENERKEYQKMMDSHRVHLRMNAQRETLLQVKMKEEGYTNKSAYMMKCIFGDEEKETARIIKGGEPEKVGLLLRNTMLELADYYIYLKWRYDKDMGQLWREEGTDVDRWAAKTNRWHIATMRKLEETFKTVRRIAFALGLDEYFRMPSDNVRTSASSASQAELDSMAEQIRRERIALGLGDILKD